ncbi:hypothetical protein R3W88_031721 [Solanum pinnatisectum]|uniref:Uncharacterized protein n=1 Tax=Solanum pinnatisectum TaxID=50273 RepID=A0AAV9LM45_9SOLN|nr:hypothetical protein R3W88_031721 [Solanum pinnatisectum]
MGAMDVSMMMIMEAMMMSMIKSRMGMRATIPEDNMRKMVNIALMVKMEKKKNLVVAPMVMREHDEGEVRYNTLLYKNYKEHAPKACEDSYFFSYGNPYPSRSSVYGYTSSIQNHPMGRRE